MTREEAGEIFDTILAEFKEAWMNQFPEEPFEIDGVVTPKAMAFIAGYVEGLKEEENT